LINSNINVIRIVASWLVIYSHSFALLINPDSQPLLMTHKTTFGKIAVDLFFFISGFLVTKSIFKNKSISYYLSSRFLRIFPAIIALTLVTVFFLGPILSKLSFYEYFSNISTFAHLRNSLIIFGLQDWLPGVFVDNPFKYSINGSLWTLPVECRSYFALLCLYYFISKLNLYNKRKKIFLLITLLLFALYFYGILNKPEKIEYRLFFLGASFFLNKSHISYYAIRIGAICSLITLSFAFFIIPLIFDILWIFCFPPILIYFCFYSRQLNFNINKFGDFSYGAYIYAFPAQQILVCYFPSMRIHTFIFLSSFIAFSLAFISYNYIEKYFLNKKKFLTRLIK